MNLLLPILSSGEVYGKDDVKMKGLLLQIWVWFVYLSIDYLSI